MVGTVTRADGPARYTNRSSLAATRPRVLSDFEALVKRAGWGFARIIEGPFSYHISLAKA